jgi:PAS domain S-box-containing protein
VSGLIPRPAGPAEGPKSTEARPDAEAAEDQHSSTAHDLAVAQNLSVRNGIAALRASLEAQPGERGLSDGAIADQILALGHFPFAETLIAAVLEQLPIGVGVTDLQGKWCLTNRLMEEHVPRAIPSTSPEGRARWRAWDERGVPIPPENWPGKRALRGDTVSPGLEMISVQSDGRERRMRVSAAPLRDPHGQIAGAIVVVQDINERKQAAVALRESEARNAFLVRFGDALREIGDPKGVEGAASRIIGEYLGANRVAYFEVRGEEYFVTRDYASGVPPLTGGYRIESFGVRLLAIYRSGQTACSRDVSTDPELPAQEREAYAAIQIGAYIGVPLVKDGKLVAGLAVHSREPRNWTRSEIALVEQTAERTWGAVERARAEGELRASEARFRAAVTAVSSLIWTNDANGKMQGEQPGWSGFTGQTREELRGYGWAKAVHPDDAQPTIDAWNQAVSEKRMFEFEHRVRRKDGEWRLCSIRAVPVLDEVGSIREWVGVHTDITERRLAEEFQKRAEEKLERTVAERTARLRETIGELEAFSYSIAHDMRAPLRSLQGFSDALISDHSERLDAVGLGYLRRIATSAGRMDKLIQDVLNYSRIVRAEFPLETVDVEQLLRGIADTYPILLPEKADLILEGSFPRVLGNEAMLTQVFSNLLGNAVKFVASGVKPCVRVWAEERGPHVRVHVRDNGIGIPADQQERIFGIFEQASKGYGGTGIGLAIVKKAVHRMGGNVAVQSEVGRGSTFLVDVQRA